MSDSKNDKKTLTKEEVLHLAELVKLELSDSEVKDLQSQLGDTIDYIKNLSELDTENVKETAHTGNQQNVTFKDGVKPTRTFTQKQATFNANQSEGGYIIVPKILDK